MLLKLNQHHLSSMSKHYSDGQLSQTIKLNFLNSFTKIFFYLLIRLIDIVLDF